MDAETRARFYEALRQHMSKLDALCRSYGVDDSSVTICRLPGKDGIFLNSTIYPRLEDGAYEPSPYGLIPSNSTKTIWKDKQCRN